MVAEIAQLGERQTEDLKVPGSNPENSLEFCIIPGLGSVFLLLFHVVVFVAAHFSSFNNF